MNIYFAGNIEILSKNFYDRISLENKCIKCNKSFGEKNDVKRVFLTYNFDTCIFFSNNINGVRKIFDEMENLEQLLYDCRRNKVRHFFYITGNDLQRYDAQNQEGTTRDLFERSCLQVCRAYAEKSDIKITVIKIPYLYSTLGTDNGLSFWIKESLSANTPSLHAKSQTITDFLNDEDLGELILRMLNEPEESPYTEIYISGENRVSFSDVEKKIRRKISTFSFDYADEELGIPCYYKNSKVRELYGWFPQNVLEDDIEKICDTFLEEKALSLGKKSKSSKLRSFWSGVRIALELILGFVVAEGLNYLIRDNIMLQFLDCRLIYVALMGTINGLNVGILAVLLSCVGYLFSISGQTQWQVVFYNVENWLPFACYFLMGAISGYTKDKHDTEVAFTKEENALLVGKYEYLSDLYKEVTDSKNEYNSQIISYQDSFGKIYSIVKKLDVTMSSEVFFEAINVLEELMENTTVAIYTLNEKADYARLNVCSKNLDDILEKSRKLSDIPEVIETITGRKVFVNIACKDKYPEYAAPIFNKDELIGMIVLEEVSASQMNLEYRNKFVIVTDLIKDSLIRAVERENNSDMFIEGTMLMKSEAFAEELSIRQKMKEKDYMDYSVLKLLSRGQSDHDMADIAKRLEKLIRTNDVMGLDEDGNLLLILSRTHKKDLGIILERMKDRGLLFEVI